MTNSSTFNDSYTEVLLPSKRGLCLPKLVLVPKLQQGVQMDLTSSDLPNEIQKIMREDSVKKIVYHAKTDHVLANFSLEMHYDFDDDNKPSVYTGYTRYETYNCSDA